MNFRNTKPCGVIGTLASSALIALLLHYIHPLLKYNYCKPTSQNHSRHRRLRVDHRFITVSIHVQQLSPPIRLHTVKNYEKDVWANSILQSRNIAPVHTSTLTMFWIYKFTRKLYFISYVYSLFVSQQLICFAIVKAGFGATPPKHKPNRFLACIVVPNYKLFLNHKESS